jgi:hypothetical protein
MFTHGLSNFGIETFEAQLLIVETGAASIAAHRRCKMLKGRNLGTCFQSFFRALCIYNTNIQIFTIPRIHFQPSLPATLLSEFTSDLPGCEQHIISSDPSHMRPTLPSGKARTGRAVTSQDMLLLQDQEETRCRRGQEQFQKHHALTCFIIFGHRRTASQHAAGGIFILDSHLTSIIKLSSDLILSKFTINVI